MATTDMCSVTPVAGPDSNAHHEQPMYSFSLSSNNRQCQQIPTAPLRASAFQQVSSGDPLRRRGSGPTTFDADIQPLRSNVGWPREPVNHPSPIPEPSYAYPPQSHSGQSTTSQAPLLDILDNVRKIRLNHPFPTRGRLRSLWSVRAKAVSELPTTTDHALRSPPNTSDFNSFTPPSQLTPQLTLNQSAFSISPLYLGALDTNSGTGIRQNAGTLDISSHISAIRTEVEPPPVYGTPEAPAPGYHVKQSPDTVAEQLFFYGFFFPPFWIVGTIILFLDMKSPHQVGNGPHPIEQQEVVTLLRAKELKWARKCLVALVLFIILIIVATAIGYNVTRILDKRDASRRDAWSTASQP